MHRAWSLVLLVLLLAGCGGEDRPAPPDASPSPTVTASATAAATLTLTPTATRTPTASPTLTDSSTATATPTLAAQVLELTAVMPGVALDTAPDVTTTPDELPLDEWTRFEDDHTRLDYVRGSWTSMRSWSASQNEYRYSTDAGAAVQLAFEGEGVRVCYVTFWNAGLFQILLDGQLVSEVDAYTPEAHFTCTDTFPAADGRHTVLVRNTGERNVASTDTMLALDAVLTYRRAPSAVTTPGSTYTPTPAPQPARRIELVQGPPSLPATATDTPMTLVSAAVLIAYDENANRAVDPAEGVYGIPVRLVDKATNRALAQAFTDASGYARIEVQTQADVRLVVPYFGQYWDISARSGASTYTLLLPAGNQPGLIP